MNLKKIGLFAIAMIMTLFSFQTYSFAAEVDEYIWTEKSPMPTGRFGMGSLVYDDKIYVYGGTVSGGSISGGNTAIFEMYDPKTNQWEQLSSSSISRYLVQFVEHQDKFYAIGGVESAVTNVVEEYDPFSNQWTNKQPMPTPRCNVGAISIGDYVYTFGGFGINNTLTNVVEVFNTKTNSWDIKNPMPVKTSETIPFKINNSIYVLVYTKPGETPSIYNYDPEQDTWTHIAEMPSEVTLPRNVIVHNEKVFFPSDKNLFYYDLKSKKLIKYPAAPLNKAINNFEIINNKLYAMGEFPNLGSFLELSLSDLVNPDPNPEPDPDPIPNPTGNALLVIYMDSGLIKEYEMTNEEIRNFTEWYEGRAKGNGREAYIVNKKYNIGPFNSRKDFISYSHIESFEVQEYSR
ncbi:kelch repeat-containing protein [Brevibacillus laterosporus]|uniref:Kelch repeat-containing protein n=1 Tax=Brevibacillus laterosporus TaxID=1465 RepID=UPI00035F9221|nr:kelch repeat-containing protein [Brevibacillus laterosporus]ATO48824.1 galactose oxidase [Brevibacillus laterosporus DSM 25]MBG9800687.1 galactose oxidase [Brevibacillus laterosporus]MED2002198.1 kelch repeat-containing protein [Brevibacillus laterosporus]MED4764893.1 kelch repeat-containing protein [Brevibacillus laterosporus]TPH17230.1 galactose oxidase [Brevibacillus laterosporus]